MIFHAHVLEIRSKSVVKWMMENSDAKNEVHSNDMSIRRDLVTVNSGNDCVPGAEAVASIRNVLPDISKLDIDCLEEVFDYLSLKDVVTAGQTSKWMQRVAGYCFTINYSAAEAKWEDGSIQMRSSDKWSFVTIFAQYINKLCFGYSNDFHNFLATMPKCLAIKQIEFVNVEISRRQTEQINEILNKVEVLRINACEVEGEFHETVLALCPNLKRLSIGSYSGVIGDTNNWMLEKYPKLEYFELQPLANHAMNELKTFLESNPSIRKLRISAECLWRNRHSILNAKVALDDLEIVEIDIESDAFLHLLNALFERQFYKRLSLNWWYFDQEAATKLATLNALVTLNAFNSERIQLEPSALSNIEELYFYKCNETNLVSLASDLINLRRIVFTIATGDDIALLISRVRNLQKIKIEKIENGTNFNIIDNILNLSALNREREKLAFAQRVTIYVSEEVFLATKWAVIQEDFRLVGIKRTESYEWDHAFRFIP